MFILVLLVGTWMRTRQTKKYKEILIFEDKIEKGKKKGGWVVDREAEKHN